MWGKTKKKKKKKKKKNILKVYNFGLYIYISHIKFIICVIKI
jgi:hypothetical protein